MGSLGDKFKKLAGDQTRQLLQNFQNAQSSKSKNGYSYGKLNEDGTATLADGTTVQVEVKGRPGQYAPVFNLGNGQGLVDQPEAKFFTVDSTSNIRWLQARVEQYQRYGISTYEAQTVAGPQYYFSMIDFTRILVSDLVNNRSYEVDPSIYSSISSIPIPSYFFGQRPNLVWNWFGTGLCSTSSFRHRADRPVDVGALDFAYSGAYVMFGSEGKDLLIYQYSNEAQQTSTFTDGTIYTDTYNIDTGELYFKYVLLKDFFF